MEICVHADHRVTQLDSDRATDAVAVLCDAFHAYPVMRYIIGPAGTAYDARLRSLVGYFVNARYLRGEPVLAVSDGNQMAAAAMVTLPGPREVPSELAERRQAVWAELGREARERYEALGEAWKGFTLPEPHHHLNMIGVRQSHAGRGFARLLLDEVHTRSKLDPQSSGVTLTTEDSGNVALYEHVGYRCTGHIRISESLESWSLYRPDG